MDKISCRNQYFQLSARKKVWKGKSSFDALKYLKWESCLIILKASWFSNTGKLIPISRTSFRLIFAYQCWSLILIIRLTSHLHSYWCVCIHISSNQAGVSIWINHQSYCCQCVYVCELFNAINGQLVLLATAASSNVAQPAEDFVWFCALYTGIWLASWFACSHIISNKFVPWWNSI